MNGSGNCDTLNEKTSENNPQEKVLSSGIQLRTSARVLKKQKLDLEASLAAAENKKDEKIEVEVTSSSQPPPPKRRGAKVFWSPEDKSAFFEALNEAGKDLEGIERYMRGKAKKRPGEVNGPCVISKTRLQVKSFYHRSLLKVGKHVQLPDNVKKSTQELYMLINYGELRKRIGLMNERNAQKLKELIYCGSTQVRVKGKAWRVKTPVCRALKRLNQLEESVDEIRLPTRVEVLVTPKDNKDRHLVESLGYNPRLKTSLSVDTPVSNLISFLRNRWTPIKDSTNESDPAVSNNLQDRIPDPGGGNNTSVSVNINATSSTLTTPCTNGLSAMTNNNSPLVLESRSTVVTVSTVQSSCLPDLTDCIVAPSLIGSPPRVPAPPREHQSPNSNTQTSQDSSASVEISASASQHSYNLDEKCRLRIGPKMNAQLTKTNYKCGQMVTSSCISLIAHQAKIGSPLASLQTLIGLVPPLGVKAGKSWAKWHKEGEPIDELKNTDICDPIALPLSTTSSTSAPVTTTASNVLNVFGSQISSTSGQSPTPVSSTSPNQTQNGSQVNPFSNFASNVSTSDVETPCESSSLNCDTQTKEETKEEFETRVRKGWSLKNSARLRIADLYLIFGSNGRLEVEYWWDGEVTSELPSLVRLLSLAKLWYSRVPSLPRECWACGHRQPIHTSTLSNTSQSSNSLLLDPKVEVKTEVVETAESTVVVVSPTIAPTTAGRFRQPLLPAPSSTKRLKSTDETYKSLQLKTKYTNRRGRYRPKNVVVQRMLPLLPKATAPAQSCTVVTLQVVAGGPAGPATGEFIKSKSRDSTELKRIAPKPSPSIPLPDLPSSKVVTMGEQLECHDIKDTKPSFRFLNSTNKNEEAVKNVSSPQPSKFSVVTRGEKFECHDVKDIPSFSFLNSTIKNEEAVKNISSPQPSNFSGILGCSSGVDDNEVVSTPPTSPSRILKEGESQWLNSEVSDFSLSSFLGHLESPLKTNGVLPLEDTRMSADVDSQLQSLMTESSLDYTAKFADLAAKIAGPGSSNGAPTAPS